MAKARLKFDWRNSEYFGVQSKVELFASGGSYESVQQSFDRLLRKRRSHDRLSGAFRRRLVPRCQDYLSKIRRPSGFGLDTSLGGGGSRWVDSGLDSKSFMYPGAADALFSRATDDVNGSTAATPQSRRRLVTPAPCHARRVRDAARFVSLRHRLYAPAPTSGHNDRGML